MTLKIAETIRRLRRERGMTQNELADRLGVSYQAVSRWENESSYPDIELLPLIASQFGVTVDYLLGSAEKCAGQAFWDRLSAIDDASARLNCLRETHRLYPEDMEVFFRLCEATWEVEECYRLTEEFLITCGIPFLRNEAIKHMVAALPEERVMSYFYEKNIPEVAWDPLLEHRYLVRGEAERYRQKRQQMLGEHLRQVFFRLEKYEGFSDMSNFQGYVRGEPVSVDVEGAKTVLAIIAALTGTRLTQKHPVAGNGTPDIWYSQRIWAALHIACGLCGTGERAEITEALGYLEDAADLLRRLRNLPPDRVLAHSRGMETSILPRSRCNLHYDARRMKQFFSSPAFEPLREDPALSLRFAIACSVFYEQAVE